MIENSYTFLIGKPPYETSDVKKTYKRIRANDYSFPEHVQISKNARMLIEGILVLDPCIITIKLSSKLIF